MTRFGLIGVGGYVAPRHLAAIRAVGGELVAAVDPADSVGVLDQYFPDAKFFTEIERFDRFLEKLRRRSDEQQIEWLSVCSPSYLHDAHVRLGLRVRAHVICEKPLVLSPWNLDALAELEQEYDRRIYAVLQLRLLPALVALEQRLEREPAARRADVVLTYVTQRGPWYHTSWKGDATRSGGIGMNIGIHLFDLLLWLFGPCHEALVHLSRPDKMAGQFELERARVRWFLSVDRADLPAASVARGRSGYRSLTLDGEEIDFSGGFEALHTEVYRKTLAGLGSGLEVARPSIELAHRLRSLEVTERWGEAHPKLRLAGKEYQG